MYFEFVPKAKVLHFAVTSATSPDEVVLDRAFYMFLDAFSIIAFCGDAHSIPGVRAVPEIILGGWAQTLFCPVGGGCFVDNVSEGWGVVER